MNATPTLEQAVALFKTLGWENQPYGKALELPLGSPAEQKLALAGLRSKNWGDYDFDSDGNYRYINHFDIDRKMLLLFAIRLGIAPEHIEDLIWIQAPPELTEVIAAQGENYMNRFVQHASTSGTNLSSRIADEVLDLVAHYGAEIPRSSPYFSTWLLFAGRALATPNHSFYPLTRFQPRFAEHLIAAGEFATPEFAKTVTAGLKQGLVTREQAIEAAGTVLTHSTRPKTRKDTTVLLFTDLAITDTELLAQQPLAFELVSTNDGIIVELIASRLLPLIVASPDYTELALSALYAKTAKAIKCVLKTLISLPEPPNVDILQPRIAELAHDKDTAIAKLAQTLLAAWNVQSNTTPTPPKNSYSWDPTPNLWKLPRFTCAEPTTTNLTEVATTIAQRTFTHHDLDYEHFRCLLVRAAYLNIDTTKQTINRIHKNLLWGQPATWLTDPEKSHRSYRGKRLLDDRDYDIATRLGTIPLLLSEPSFVDLSVTPEDFITRLQRYDVEKVAAHATDLILALCRINFRALATAEFVDKLANISVPVVKDDQTQLPHSAAEIALAYAHNPITFDLANPAEIPATPNPPAFADLPNYFQNLNNTQTDHAIFPHFITLSATSFAYDTYHDPTLGQQALQFARQATPLPKSIAVNMLGIQRKHSSTTVLEQCFQAALNAWHRGLLRPENIDINYLDHTGALHNLQALVEPCTQLAKQGLLAVIWEFFDQILAASAQAPRLLAGTAEIANAMAEFAPAIPTEAATAPGLTALARKKGKSKAVLAAQQAVALLPK